MAFLAVLVIIMVPPLIAAPAKSLQVRTDTGDVVWCAPLNHADVLQLQFTHSMYGGYVREHWRLTPDNQLERIRFVTENAAAAEYYATDGTSYRDSDGFVVPGGPLREVELVVRVNNRGNHVLTVGNQTVHLAEQVPQSTRVHIAVAPGSCGTEN